MNRRTSETITVEQVLTKYLQTTRGIRDTLLSKTVRYQRRRQHVVAQLVRGDRQYYSSLLNQEEVDAILEDLDILTTLVSSLLLGGMSEHMKVSLLGVISSLAARHQLDPFLLPVSHFDPSVTAILWYREYLQTEKDYLSPWLMVNFPHQAIPEITPDTLVLTIFATSFLVAKMMQTQFTLDRGESFHLAPVVMVEQTKRVVVHSQVQDIFAQNQQQAMILLRMNDVSKRQEIVARLRRINPAMEVK